MDCFGTLLTHVQTCDVTRVQSATEWTATVHTLHMSKSVMQPVFKVLRNGLLRYTYFTHVQTCDVTRVQGATEWTASVHTSHICDVTCVQSATGWTASVHFLHMSKPVM